MVFVYLAAILFVSLCFVLYFVLAKKKHDERLADFRQKKTEEEIKSYELETKENKEESKEIKAELEDFEIIKKEKKDVPEKKTAEEPAQQAQPAPQPNSIFGGVDISDVDFEALENMDDDAFDEALRKFSPEKRDAVLDELLRRNED